MQGRRYARRRIPSTLRGSVDDIAASEDIHLEFISWKPLKITLIVYIVLSAL